MLSVGHSDALCSGGTIVVTEPDGYRATIPLVGEAEHYGDLCLFGFQPKETRTIRWH